MRFIDPTEGARFRYINLDHYMDGPGVSIETGGIKIFVLKRTLEHLLEFVTDCADKGYKPEVFEYPIADLTVIKEAVE